ncbi:MAG: CDP-diacylglycerol--serine O-phosphatidyltransferase [Armatimonadota bacterium]
MRSKLAWLPNMLTMGNLFCGFLAILFAIMGHESVTQTSAINWDNFYFRSMLMMLVAALFDFFDGFFARKLHVTSDFGRELDSLCDLVSFGVAPAILIYEYALSDMHWLGIVAVGFYVCCGAGRLARYNVIASGGRKPYFVGMPIEGGMAILISIVLTPHTVPIYIAVMAVILAGLLMISTLRFSANVPWYVQLGALALMVIGFRFPGDWIILIPMSYIAYALLGNLQPLVEEPASLPEAAFISGTVTEEQVPMLE